MMCLHYKDHSGSGKMEVSQLTLILSTLGDVLSQDEVKKRKEKKRKDFSYLDLKLTCLFLMFISLFVVVSSSFSLFPCVFFFNISAFFSRSLSFCNRSILYSKKPIFRKNPHLTMLSL